MKNYVFKELSDEEVQAMSQKDRRDYYDQRDIAYAKNRFNTRVKDGLEEVLRKASKEFINTSIEISSVREKVDFVKKDVIDPYHYLNPIIYKNIVTELLEEIDDSITEYSPIEKIEQEIEILIGKLFEANRSLELERNKNA